MNVSRLVRWLSIAALLAVTTAVYYPGLEGPFLLDDRENILRSPSMAMTDLSVTSVRNALYAWKRAYPHRGLARLSFALNHYLSGGRFDAFAFKATNLAIHLANGLLVYWLSVLLFRRFAGGARPPSAEAGFSAMQTYLPLLVAALWLLHPIQLTSVLYVVQRMTGMAALFVFAGLAVFVIGRARLESGRGHGLVLMSLGLGGGMALGFLCKQNAVLLPFYAFLVELFFFRREVLGRIARRRLYVFYAITVAVPVVLGVLGLIVAWDRLIEGYLHRSFTPWERLLTQSRVLFFYLGLMLLPDIRAFGLYHDDIAPSHAWLEPWTTLPSVALWAVLVALALWGVRRRAIWSFALLWYLAGHTLESSLLGLELVYEHRNYVPSFGVMFAVAFYIVWGLGRVGRGYRVAGAVSVALVLVLSFITFTRAGAWGDRLSLVEHSLRNHPESSRSHGEYALLLTARVADIGLIFHHWQRSAALEPDSVLELIEMSRILNAQIPALEAAAAPASTQPLPRDPFGAPLVVDAAYLRALDALVAAEIEARLADRPVSMGSVGALRTLETCIERGLAPCVALLPRAIEWMRIAKGNPRIARRGRSVLLVTLARLEARAGDFDAAIENAEAAARLEPDVIYFLVELAQLYISVEDWASAERAIGEARELASFSGYGSASVDELESRLDRARSARGTAAGG